MGGRSHETVASPRHFTFAIDTHQRAWLRVDGTTVALAEAAAYADWFSTISIGGRWQHVCTAGAEGCVQFGHF